MSKLAALDDLLELYYQLNYHQNLTFFGACKMYRPGKNSACRPPIVNSLLKSRMY